MSYAYMLLFSLRFTEVFWLVYLREKGLSFAAIGLLETVFHVASFSSEVPTGLVADRWGRKVSVAAGRLAAAASAAVTLSSRNVPALAAAFALNAVSYTFHSGAFEALVYDTVRERQLGDFTKIWGRMNSTYLIGTSVTAGCAALMVRAGLPLDMLYKAAIAIDLFAVGICLLIPEDLRRIPAEAEEDRSKARGIFASLALDAKTMAAALKRADLRNLFFAWAVVSSLATSVTFYGQSFLKESLVPLSLVGWARMAANLVSVIPTRSAHLIEKRFGRGRLIAWGCLAMPAVIFAMATIPARLSWCWRALLVALYLSVTVVSETLYPVFSNAANSLIESRHRAAILSSAGMLFSVSMMVIFPAVGFLGDRIGLGSGLALAAILASGALAPLSRRIKKRAGEAAECGAD